MSGSTLVVVPFPFVDAPQAKPRPALVLSTRAFNVANGHTALAMITRGAATRWPSVHRLADLAATGLKVESVVRWKVFTLDNRIIRRRIGSLAGAVPTAATGLSARSCWGGLDGLLRACDHGWPRRGEARRRGMGCAASARGGG